MKYHDLFSHRQTRVLGCDLPFFLICCNLKDLGCSFLFYWHGDPISVPEGSGLLLVLPEWGHYSFALTLVTGLTWRYPRDLPCACQALPHLCCWGTAHCPLGGQDPSQHSTWTSDPPASSSWILESLWRLVPLSLVYKTQGFMRTTQTSFQVHI